MLTELASKSSAASRTGQQLAEGEENEQVEGARDGEKSCESRAKRANYLDARDHSSLLFSGHYPSSQSDYYSDDLAQKAAEPKQISDQQQQQDSNNATPTLDSGANQEYSQLR